MITPEQVKELRGRTGSGIMDCKKALVETDGDMEKAITVLTGKRIGQSGKETRSLGI